MDTNPSKDLTPVMAMLLEVAIQNPDWEREDLLDCRSSAGPVTDADIDTALDRGWLVRVEGKWQVPEHLDTTIHALYPGELCACNRAAIPYAGRDIVTDPARYTCDRGVNHGWDDCWEESDGDDDSDDENDVL